MEQDIFSIRTNGPGLYEFTTQVAGFVKDKNVERGILNLFCRHTSCSLLVQENADPDVQVDLKEFFARLVPQGMDWITHTMEGPDDMPAHIKAAMMPVSLSIPVLEGLVGFGTWQGVYLFEHRVQRHDRQVIAHLTGE
ncbi:MAG: secondary thiamine-phosphate synthase enzyme YjbQ [Devosiaceae bacterium]|nr:secondary thiamine-phosphate synthase enzyme YjbQ [Devosiaceae bacterium]